MSTSSNLIRDNHSLTRPIRWIERRARGFFRPETRALRRQNAIRGMIANLIETERMRLAAMVAHRHDG